MVFIQKLKRNSNLFENGFKSLKNKKKTGNSLSAWLLAQRASRPARLLPPSWAETAGPAHCSPRQREASPPPYAADSWGPHPSSSSDSALSRTRPRPDHRPCANPRLGVRATPCPYKCLRPRPQRPCNPKRNRRLRSHVQGRSKPLP